MSDNANPINIILSIIREEIEELINSNPPYYIGKIKSPLPNLEVSWGDAILYKQQLKIDKALLDRHNVAISCSSGNITHNLTDKLNVGDEVIMLRNGNEFTIISKVVSLND